MHDVTPAQIQRSVLEDLLVLAERRGVEQARLEEAQEQQRVRIEVRAQRAARRLGERRARLEQALRQQHEARVHAISERFQTHEQQLRREVESVREVTTEEAEKNLQAARKELDHALWVAESVYEAEQAKLAKEFDELEKRCDAYGVTVEKAQREAGILIKRYGQEHLLQPVAASGAGKGSAEDDKEAAEAADASPEQVMAQAWKTVDEKLARLQSLQLPGWFTAFQAHLVGILVLGGIAAWALWRTQWQLTLESGGIIAWAAVIIAALVFGLSVLSKKQVRETFVPLREAAAAGREAADRHVTNAALRRQEILKQRRAHRDAVVTSARQKFGPILDEIRDRREGRLRQLDERRGQRLAQLTERRDSDRRQADQTFAERLVHLEQRYDRLERAAKQRRTQEFADRDARLAAQQQVMQEQWRQAWARAAALADEAEASRLPAWSDPWWRQWTPASEMPAGVSFGQLEIDAEAILTPPPAADAGDAAKEEDTVDASTAERDDGKCAGRRRGLPMSPPEQSLLLPAMLDLPRRGSVLWEFGAGAGTGDGGREQAIRGVQALMARLLTSLPPGHAKLTILDPVGLGQNFAGFMHLVDYQEDLVTGRIWTGSDQIEQRLIDLTEHMENVIQKYLRNEFDTIDQYNVRAEELAEPYRFLVVTDFPANFSESAVARLKSIVTSGPRCGVFTLIAADARHAPPGLADLSDLTRHCIHLVNQDGRFVWKDPVLGRFPLRLDTPPDEETLTHLMQKVGEGARHSSRVEVPFESIAPSAETTWSRSSDRSVHVPIGRSGATRLQELVLGRDVAQHALLAGKTGSGKSTLLHVIITNLALWYGPDQIEFYLIDFKKGVEFKAYATHRLPHARAVAVESDREFGLSVLRRLDAEISRRGDLFRAAGVQELAAYREAAPETHLPRTLLVIDEFQEFFSEDDSIAQDAGLLLDRLVRQGRAFGIHVLLGSQTLGGTSNLPRSTIGQMAIRIALQCSDADSQLILSDSNTAARLLSRPGEAIYNDAGGMVEGNSPFQVSWLPDQQRDAHLKHIRRTAEARGVASDRLIVFEGNAPAEIGSNQALQKLLAQETWTGPPTAPAAWLGEAVAIKESTAVVFRRQSGANLLLIGQQEESATAIMLTAMLSLAAQHPPARPAEAAGEAGGSRGGCRFYLFDGTPADSPHVGMLGALASVLPHPAEVIAWRDVPIAVEQLARETQRRLDSGESDQPPIFVFVHALQRYRMLRRQEDDFGLSMSDEDDKPRPDRDFATLLREGSSVGIHTIVWCDTPTTLDRTLDRQAMKEFDNRVLFQMSGNDSSNLIDSPAAANLGYHRALFANDEQGILEKFRPYALPERAWLEKVVANLAARPSVAAAVG